ncbi:MAG: tetratricopeptide repeat protein [Deltaproteobacteria bacterium]|nr:MAG: tetratricopeptide repeat protein [Deltaproteobacteria bacterium]
MAFDRTKILAAAGARAARGQLRAAIALYRSVVERDPNDASTWIKLADLYRRSNRSADAAVAYRRAAALFRARGFAARAVAALEQAVRIAPDDPDARIEVADVHAELGHHADAARHLVRAADALCARGRPRDAVVALRRVAAIAPNEPRVRERLIAACAGAGRMAEAIEHAVALADLYLRAGQPKRALHVLEPLAAESQDHPDLRAALARARRAAPVASAQREAGANGPAPRAAGVEVAPLRVAPRAARPLARGTERRPPDPSARQAAALFAEAIAYAKVGLADRAIPLLREVLAIQPDHDLARRALHTALRRR